jgi:hypothetical protein
MTIQMTEDDKNTKTERTIADDTLIITKQDGGAVAEFTRMYVGHWSVWVKKTTDKSRSAA